MKPLPPETTVGVAPDGSGGGIPSTDDCVAASHDWDCGNDAGPRRGQWATDTRPASNPYDGGEGLSPNCGGLSDVAPGGVLARNVGEGA